MKTYRHLYPQITDFGNLYAAFCKARKGKRDRPAVAAFEYDLETNLFQLQEELRNREYQPGAYRNFYIRERKLRLISAAPFRDRVVHHALCAVINPIIVWGESSRLRCAFRNRNNSRNRNNNLGIRLASTLSRFALASLF